MRKWKPRAILGFLLAFCILFSAASFLHSSFSHYTVGEVPVSDVYYYKHLGASRTYRKQIQELPEYLLKTIHSITITDYEYSRFSHIKFSTRNIFLIPEQEYVEFVVLHEAIHAFDSYYDVSASEDYRKAIVQDKFTETDDIRESFVTVMRFYVMFPDSCQRIYPEIYRVIDGIVKGD